MNATSTDEGLVRPLIFAGICFVLMGILPFLKSRAMWH
jgi:hypothetical protein